MRPSILVLLLLALPSDARAQVSHPSIFVEGALFDDLDVPNTRAADTMGGALTVGLRLSRRFSIRFDAEVPGFHTYTYPAGSAFFRVAVSETFRTSTYIVSFAGHIPAGKTIDVGLLAGLGRGLRESRLSGFEEYLYRDGTVARHEDINYRYVQPEGALTFGTDVAVRLTSHLAVVPELRANISAYDGVGVAAVHSKLALRWTF
jgi:hypothetical protein